MEIYNRLFSFKLEDGFILLDISHLPLINSLYETRSLNWLSWEPIILDFFGEIFLTFMIDIVNPYDISVYY